MNQNCCKKCNSDYTGKDVCMMPSCICHTVTVEEKGGVGTTGGNLHRMGDMVDEEITKHLPPQDHHENCRRVNCDCPEIVTPTSEEKNLVRLCKKDNGVGDVTHAEVVNLKRPAPASNGIEQKAFLETKVTEYKPNGTPDWGDTNGIEERWTKIKFSTLATQLYLEATNPNANNSDGFRAKLSEALHAVADKAREEKKGETTRVSYQRGFEAALGEVEKQTETLKQEVSKDIYAGEDLFPVKYNDALADIKSFIQFLKKKQ